MIVLFIRARLENVAKVSLPPGYTYTVTVRGEKRATCFAKISAFESAGNSETTLVPAGEGQHWRGHQEGCASDIKPPGGAARQPWHGQLRTEVGARQQACRAPECGRDPQGAEVQGQGAASWLLQR